MYYVYTKHIRSGKEYFCRVYENADDAVRKIRTLYNLDEKTGQLGEYYYYMKQR